MLSQLNTQVQNLYEIDYNLWVMETVKHLKNRDFSILDLENLVQEINDLGKRDKRKLENLLTRLLEHLLKLGYWDLEKERNRGHWQGKIRTFRKQIQRELRDSPSLKGYCQEIFEDCYQDARHIVSDKAQLPIDRFPQFPMATLEKILDEDWLP